MNRPSPGYALEAALESTSLGYRVVPIHEGKKYPPIAWKRYQNEAPTEADLRRWFAKTRHGIALVCGDVVMIDVDNPEELDFVLDNCLQKNSPNDPAICTTPRGGFHIHTQARQGATVSNRIKIKGREIDLRTKGGLAIVPPTPGYQWQQGHPLIALDSLPVFKSTWTKERKSSHRSPHEYPEVTDQAAIERIRRARAYLAHIEGAISGQGGHNQAMRAAGVLIQKFDLSIEQAWPLYLEWNEACEPPFTEQELTHKLTDAVKNKDRYVS